MNDKTPTTDPIRNQHTNAAYHDYDVHMLIEDVGEGSNYLLKVGTVFERMSGELSGDTIYGKLILKAHRFPTADRYRDVQIKDVHVITSSIDEWRPNA